MSSTRVLRTFLAVTTEGSFAAAAQRVALTQAAVGQQMRSLEAELRRPLFERQGKSVALSDSGREMLPAIRKLVLQYERLLAAGADSGSMAGTVHLGAVVSAVRTLLQGTLALKARHPALELHVSAAKSRELLEQVAAGKLDAAIAVREPGTAMPSLAWTPLYSEPLVLLTPRSLEPAAPRALLRSQPFIRFDSAQHTGQLIERSLRRLRVKPQQVLELNAIEAIVDLVRSGLGVALLPNLRSARWASDARLRVLEVADAEERRIALVQRRDANGSALVSAVARALQDELLTLAPHERQ